MADVPNAVSPLTWARIARRIRVPLGFVLAVFYLWRAQPTWASLAAGVVIASFGIVVRALAAGHVKKNRELTTSGPYAYVRNPLYLGSIILGVGFAVAACDLWVAVAIVALFIFVYVPVIRSEESFLRSQFQEYDDYASRVPSLLPRTLLFRRMTSDFSPRLYFCYREYNSLLGAAAITAALVVKKIWFPR